MKLSQPQKSHDPDDFGGVFVNTSDSNNKGKLGFGWYVNLSSEFGLNKVKDTFLLASISARQLFW